MDFTALISVLSSGSSPLLVALTAIAGVVILPGVVRWGFNQVLRWFDVEEDDADDDERKPCFFCGGLFEPEWLDHSINGIACCAECFDYTRENI